MSSYRLFILALGGFVIGTDLFVIAGILPVIVEDLHISVSDAGFLVTVFALTYAISSPILASISANFNRRNILVASLMAFTLANVLAALSSTFVMLIITRIIAALAASLYSPLSSAIAVSLVSPEKRGRALAIVLGGLTVAIVLGVPLGTLVGTAYGWRATFWLIAVIGGLATVSIMMFIPSTPNSNSIGLYDRIALLVKPKIFFAILPTILWTVGGFTIYTYIAEILRFIAHLDANTIAAILLLFGAASVAGNYLGGYMADLFGPLTTISIGLGVLVLDFFLLPWSSTIIVGACIIVGVWGIAGWMINPPQQHRLVGLAPDMPGIILSLNGSAIYLGIGIGAALGAWIISIASVSVLPYIGSLCEILALGFFWVSIRFIKK